MNKRYIRKPIGSVANIRRGASPRPIDEWMSSTGVPWVKISDATRTDSRFIWKTEGYIFEEGRHKSVEVFPEDLIISNSATPGLPKIMKIHACIHDGWLLADNFNGVTRDYLFYQIKYLRKYLINQGNGSIFTNLKTDILKEFPISIPIDNNGDIDIAGQERLANVLATIEDKMENNNAINAELEAMAKTIYDYWFLQFEFPDENGKPYKSSGGKMVYNEELKREIPEGWSIEKISSVAMLYQPQTISENEMVADGKYFVYGANGIVGRYHSYNHENNEIAICCRGASCGQFTMTQPLAWITGNAMVVKPTSFCGREYLFYGLSYKTIEPFITGSAQPQITRANLENMRVMIPDKEIVQQFEIIALGIRSKTQLIFAENQELASLRDFLLPLLMNGQVGFKEEE